MGRTLGRAVRCRTLIQSSVRCLFQIGVLLEGSVLLKAKNLSADYLPVHQQSETYAQPEQAGGISVSELELFQFNVLTVNQTLTLIHIYDKKVAHNQAYL